MKLQRQIDKLLAQRASEWHQILENADESERAEFVSWLKQSPLQEQEYLETVYTDQVLKHVDAEATEDVDTLIAQMSQTVVPLTGVSAGPASRGLRPKRGGVGIGWAAAVALCALLLPLVLRHFENAAEYATALGEQRTIQLAD